MINNAKRYNSPGTFAHGEAIALEMFFEKRELNATTFVPKSQAILQNGRESAKRWSLTRILIQQRQRRLQPHYQTLLSTRIPHQSSSLGLNLLPQIDRSSSSR